MDKDFLNLALQLQMLADAERASGQPTDARSADRAGLVATTAVPELLQADGRQAY